MAKCRWGLWENLCQLNVILKGDSYGRQFTRHESFLNTIIENVEKQKYMYLKPEITIHKSDNGWRRFLEIYTELGERLSTNPTTDNERSRICQHVKDV